MHLRLKSLGRKKQDRRNYLKLVRELEDTADIGRMKYGDPRKRDEHSQRLRRCAMHLRLKSLGRKKQDRRNYLKLVRELEDTADIVDGVPTLDFQVTPSFTGLEREANLQLFDEGRMSENGTEQEEREDTKRRPLAKVRFAFSLWNGETSKAKVGMICAVVVFALAVIVSALLKFIGAVFGQ